MTQDIGAFFTGSTTLLAFGEPTHLEPAFSRLRNEFLDRLAGLGFRSIAIESDRVAGFAVDDFVRCGVGDLDLVSRNGFSHGLGELDVNRQLVTWLREYNETRPEQDKLAFHGFDMPVEMVSAPSPRRYLEHARDYLGLDTDLDAGDDERWCRTEAIMDFAQSPGRSPEADRLRVLADDLLTALYTRAPELIAATSRTAWYRAHTHVTAGLGLLRYHRQSAEPLDQATRTSHLLGVRDAVMAQNLLDIRTAEAPRGPTFVFAQNRHLQRHPSTMDTWGMDLEWHSAGAIVSGLLGEQYTFVAGSLGASAAIDLAAPEPGTFEGLLRQRFSDWGLTTEVEPGRVRTDPTPEQGYFPLDQATVDGADAVLFVSA
jgi:erythromycin esterase-like protein